MIQAADEEGPRELREGKRVILAGGRDKACAGAWWRLSYAAAIPIAFLSLFPLGPAHGETLEQALADAYLINPGLSAERARLRATDEQVAIAKAGLRPNISWSGETDLHQPEFKPRFSKGSRPPRQYCRHTLKRLHDRYIGPNFGRRYNPRPQLYVHPVAADLPGV